MNNKLEQEKLAYFHRRSQYVVFDNDGYVQDSCQTLFTISSSVSLFDAIPFLEAMRDVFVQLEVGTDVSFLCIKTDLLGREGYFNFFVKRHEENKLTWFVYDLTEFYAYLQPWQQERNDQAIASEYLRLQQRANALEKELLQYRNDELQRIEQMKTVFFSQVSHEMRTPLNSIMGLAHLIEEQASPSLKASVEALKTTAQHLSSIVNDVLDWGKLENNTVEVDNKPFLIRPLVQNIIQSFQSGCQEKGVMLEVDMDEAVPDCLEGDATRISQILYNVLGNAVKFTHEGEVSLSVETIGVHKKNARFRFTIADTGIGMSEEEKKRIANPYAQANDQIHQRYGGTGLGLSIVQKLVERLNGTWTIESQPQQGTTVMIQLSFPVVEASKVETAPKPPAFQRIRKVLVAEDDLINQKVLRQLLVRWNIQPTLVENGKEALACLRQSRYDLLILDYQMPQMDGKAVLQALQQEKRAVPVIVLSGNADQVILPQREKETTLVLSKPILPTVLQEKMILLEKLIPASPIDLQYLHQITDSQPDLMIELMDTFVQQAPLAIQHIRSAWQQQDAKLLHQAVHKARPGFQYIGATTIEQQLDRLEACTQQPKQNEQFEEIIQALEKMTQGAINQIEEEREYLLRL